MEEGGFQLVAQPEEYWVSWIAHTPRHCGGEACLPATAPWRWVNAFDGVCNYCPTSVPDSLLTLWKLHNWDMYTKALQIRRELAGHRFGI